MSKYTLLDSSYDLDNKNTTFEKYKTWCEKLDRTYISLIIQILHIVLLMSIFIPSFIELYNQNQNENETNLNTCSETISMTHFLFFGPSNNLCFLGKNIDTWSKWILYMFLFAFTQGISSASAELSNAWFSNQLANPEIELNPILSHINVQLYYINWALDNVLSIFTALTQIDFLLASIFGSSIITLLTTIYYFKEKYLYIKKQKLKDIEDIENIINNDYVEEKLNDSVNDSLNDSYTDVLLIA
jgi:hypothetical protein